MLVSFEVMKNAFFKIFVSYMFALFYTVSHLYIKLVHDLQKASKHAHMVPLAI